MSHTFDTGQETMNPAMLEMPELSTGIMAAYDIWRRHI